MLTATRPTPTIADVLPLPRRGRGRLGIDTATVDELLYAVRLRLDTLGTNAADQATRARLEDGRRALELEASRILAR